MADLMHGWIRQILGETGQVNHADAMRGLAHIERNAKAGLFGTTGGAVSLLGRDVVQRLHQSNRGLFPKFRPLVPDVDNRPAKTLSDWYVASVEQALFHLPDPFDPRLASIHRSS